MIINENNIMLKLRYPELYVEESWQNRPVIWFVAKREGYNGMMQNENTKGDTAGTFSEVLLKIKSDALTQDSSLKVFPNPFKDFFIVESPVDDKILIQEPTGRIILQQKMKKGNNLIQSKRLTNGMYYVRFVNQSKTFKLIKR